MILYKIFLGLFTPLSLVFSFYIHVNGSYIPGGAFQAGALIASLFGAHLFFLEKFKNSTYIFLYQTLFCVVFLFLCTFLSLFLFSFEGKAIYNLVVFIEWCIFYVVALSLSLVVYSLYHTFYNTSDRLDDE